MPRIFPLADARPAKVSIGAPPRVAPSGAVADVRGRPLRDLRISVTDRCNFRCVYCMPKDVFGRDYPFLPHSELLTFEEIARVAGIFVRLGVRKIRLTGGEPLLRRNLEQLVALLAEIPGVDLTLTTNGELPLEAADANYAGEVAERWRYRDGTGEIGVIASVTQAFCRDCTRARLSTDGKMFTCLFATDGYDLRSLLRGNRDDAEIENAVAALWRRRADRYSEIRSANTGRTQKIE